MKPTRFPIPASGVTERIAGFTQHLRSNGYGVGVRESASVLSALETLDIADSDSLRLACKAICATRADHFKQFDDVFDAYWFNQGRQKQGVAETASSNSSSRAHNFRPDADDAHMHSGEGTADQVDTDSDGESYSSGEGKLVGSRFRNLSKVDLREFMTPESLEQASDVAKRLANAMCDRLSRRRIRAKRGSLLDMRRIMRDCISHGGEPFNLFKRQKPLRPVKIVTLLDVSGSMLVYSRVFLAFLKGLVSHDAKTTAYLFHTSLVCISDDLRDQHTLRAVNALSIKAQGFGGGTRIGHNLEQFNRQYAANTVNARSVVIILSDGYDTDPPERLANALARLRKRGCKIIWLNQLKGWRDYAPVAQGMAAALPFLDVFAAANTLESLAQLEPHLTNI